MQAMKPIRVPVSRREVKRVTMLRTVEALHGFGNEDAKPVTMAKGWVYGNVEGHFNGMSVYTYADGTLRLSLYTESAGFEWWEDVPADAVSFEG